jgi:hypothetical protein
MDRQRRSVDQPQVQDDLLAIAHLGLLNGTDVVGWAQFRAKERGERFGQSRIGWRLAGWRIQHIPVVVARQAGEPRGAFARWNSLENGDGRGDILCHIRQHHGAARLHPFEHDDGEGQDVGRSEAAEQDQPQPCKQRARPHERGRPAYGTPHDTGSVRSTAAEKT